MTSSKQLCTLSYILLTVRLGSRQLAPQEMELPSARTGRVDWEDKVKWRMGSCGGAYDCMWSCVIIMTKGIVRDDSYSESPSQCSTIFHQPSKATLFCIQCNVFFFKSSHLREKMSWICIFVFFAIYVIITFYRFGHLIQNLLCSGQGNDIQALSVIT